VGLRASPSRSCSRSPVIEGLWKGTIFGTIGAMILGVGLGVVPGGDAALDNPVLRGVAFVYTWFFRAMPRYVLLAILGLASASSTP
jgi:polar amino acid transport system permease protein